MNICAAINMVTTKLTPQLAQACLLKNHEPGASMQTSLVCGVLVPAEQEAKK